MVNNFDPEEFGTAVSAIIRKELLGVAEANGKLTAQLESLQKQVQELQQAIKDAPAPVSVKDAWVDQEGALRIKFSDGYEKFCGIVKGAKGEPGPQGEKGDKGEKGDQGDIGPKGEPGDAGAQGEQGEVGPAGPMGERGPEGPVGPKGEKGDKGDPGEKGDVGAQGEKGEKGDPGETGPQGEKGPKGEKGEKGDPGVRGEPGAKGERGEKGDPGIQGEQGPRGERGEKGDQGDRGAPGPEPRNIREMMIDASGHLHAIMSDGAEKDLGRVVGESFSSMDIRYLEEEHEIEIVGECAGQKKSVRYPAGGLRPRGYWRDGKSAQAGDVFSLHGQAWAARCKTSARPDFKSADWVLLVQRGRDGAGAPVTIAGDSNGA